MYLVNWEEESDKAKALVMKAEIADALLADTEESRDSYDPPQAQGKLKNPLSCQLGHMPPKAFPDAFTLIKVIFAMLGPENIRILAQT